ncbi:hypothetical protein FQA39_LY08467 [Lamprigera yunnana]|nr:hypothetical protein FQA39_LY08467 [Lamprigera yunnana]
MGYDRLFLIFKLMYSLGIYFFNPSKISDYIFINEVIYFHNQTEIQSSTPETVPRSTHLNYISSSSTEGNLQNDENRNDKVVAIPEKLLHEISPLPGQIANLKGRSNKIAQIFTSQEHIEFV